MLLLTAPVEIRHSTEMPVYKWHFLPVIITDLFPEIEASDKGVTQHIVEIGRKRGKEEGVFIARKLSKSIGIHPNIAL